jgi:hypothetical protein
VGERNTLTSSVFDAFGVRPWGGIGLSGGGEVVCKACREVWEYDEAFETWSASGKKWGVEEMEKTG